MNLAVIRIHAMSLSPQEKRELAHLLAFKDALPDFPDGKISREGRQSKPDFRVLSPECVVGIEHTEVYHRPATRGLSLQAQETYTERIATRARELYESRGQPQVSVWIRFATNARLNRRIVEPLAHQLATVVEYNVPKDGFSTDMRQTWHPADPLPRQFSAVTIFRSDRSKHHLWWPLMGGAVPEIPVEYIRERIEHKNSKVDTYKTRCDEAWLLIVVDGSRPSTFFDVSGPALDHSYDSRFDQTYLFDFQKGRAFQLKAVVPRP